MTELIIKILEQERQTHNDNDYCIWAEDDDLLNLANKLKQALIIHSVVSGEIRANKELIELIKIVKGVEKENIGKCVDMTIRDVVRIPIDRLKRRFNKESI